MKRVKTAFFCRQCGNQSVKWLGRCPSCGEWNSFVEEPVSAQAGADAAEFATRDKPRSIDSIEAGDRDRTSTGLAEMDRVLGGGIVKGSVVLIGGEPGIGKSTVLLQMMECLASRKLPVLYVSGEESASQIKLRALRIGALSADLLVLVEVSLENIMDHILSVNPTVAVIDSIQTICSADLPSPPGSVGQVRESSEKLILMAKRKGIPLFLVGHVTKEGAIAGPKILEHMVDTVLYFEGDSGHAFRIIRAVKNRFGPTNEIGVFQMSERGLEEVTNPSSLFLSERPIDASGSVVIASMEGTRPLLVELQALVCPSNFGAPRRTCIGVDHNRVSLLAAVLEKVLGLRLASQDIFVNVAGGVRLDEPAADLGIVAAIMSSYWDQPVEGGTVVCGEVGLAGEVRAIGQRDERVKEAARLGFNKAVLPPPSRSEKPSTGSQGTLSVRSLSDLSQVLFQGNQRARQRGSRGSIDKTLDK
ncbi:MAG: DNA repair protein RadA [Deltaproteobacteria bacterium]|nr:DNA repair protein RadA [Deltaproteobacteria bacterium]